MPFRRSGLRLRPIHRIKHVVDSQDSVAVGVVLVKNLTFTVDNPVISSPDQVETGSHIYGIFLKVEVYATSAAALANAYMSVTKNVGGNIPSISPNNVGVNDSKRYVIHQEMVMLEQSVNGNPRTLFSGVIKIPRGYARFGPDDRLELRVLAPGVTINVCAQTHYKEFK